MSDRLTLAIDRLASQFDDRLNIIDLLTAVIQQFDETDNMLNDLLLLRTLELAEGVWLDNVGDIVGVKRPSEELPDHHCFAYTDIPGSPGNPFKGYGSVNHDPVYGDVFLDGNFEIDPSGIWIENENAILEWSTDLPHSGLHCGVIRPKPALEGEVFVAIYQRGFVVGQNYPLKGYVKYDGTQIPVIVSDGVTLWTGTNSTEYQFFEFSTGILTDSTISFGFNIEDPMGHEIVIFDDIELDNGHYSSIYGLPLGIPVNDTTYRKYIKAKALATYAKPTIRTIYAYIQNAFDISCAVFNDDLPGYVLVELRRFLTGAERRLLIKYAPIAAGMKIAITNWPDE